MKRLAIIFAAVLLAIPAWSIASRQARAGGSVDAITVQVTGSPLRNITSSPVDVSPMFTQATTDYVWRCQFGLNNFQLTLTAASGGTLTVGGRSGSSATVEESLIENQALVVTAPDPGGGATPVQYWIRCLPHDFPALTVAKPGNPSPGWYLTGNVLPAAGSGTYAMVLDTNGTPVWYRKGASPGIINVTPLADGSIAWISGSGPFGIDANGAFEDYNLALQVTRWLQSPISPTDLHELHQMPNGDLLMLSTPLKPNVDLTGLGLSSSSTIVDCVLQEVDPTGGLMWQWRASDHISSAESTHPFVQQIGGQPVYDIYHCNSIDMDPVSGDLLLSARHADAVFLIDKTTGAVVWKIGGTSSNYDQAQILTITGDPDGAFHAQHDARFEPNGDVSLYDNQTWDPRLAARAVEYHIDTNAGTATFGWSYQSTDGRNSAATGSFRRLNNGTDNVIGWGFKPGTLFTEVDAAGNVMLNVTFPNGELAYRVQKVGPTDLDHNLLRATAGLPPFSFVPDTDPTVAGTGATLSATEGMSFGGAVATFTDPDPTAASDEYLATIAWGDGSSSPGTISGPPGGPFTVSGSHTYAEEGTNAITAYIIDPGDRLSNPVTLTSTAIVSDAPLTASGTSISTSEGMSFTGAVGSITDANPNAAAGDYSVMVAWGDGSSSPGTVGGPTGGPFTVSGTHTYAEEGTDTLTISVTDVDSASNGVTATSTANGADAALAASCATPANSVNTFNGTTASFSDADSNGTVSDYGATIDWGDGSSSPGTVGANDAVSGSHAYTSTGPFTVTTTIDDAGGSSASTSCQVLVFAFAPRGGAFAIGNNTSWIGAGVTFWGSQWWKLNPLSGGAAPASFKGFAQAPSSPACGIGWSTSTSGISPAGPLPTYMGVIVTSSATQNGGVTSGNAVHLVIVKTNPGYQPSTGTPGTGTVVAQVC